MKKLTLLLILFFLWLPIAHACICNLVLFENQVRELPYIFTGRVLTVEYIFEESNPTWEVGQKTTIAIDKMYKGNQNETYTVITNLTSCGYTFEVNQEYLVFATFYLELGDRIDQNFIDTNDQIETNMCYRTRNIKYSKDAIRLLEKLYASNQSIDDISPDKLYNEVWENELFILTEEKPEFPGGYEELKQFIQSNLQPCQLTIEPPQADTLQIDSDSTNYEFGPKFETKQKTKVWVFFDISETGELSNFRIDTYFSLSQECNEEAMRVFRLMPNWNPGKIRGIPVNTFGSLFIDFK